MKIKFINRKSRRILTKINAGPSDSTTQQSTSNIPLRQSDVQLEQYLTLQSSVPYLRRFNVALLENEELHNLGCISGHPLCDLRLGINKLCAQEGRVRSEFLSGAYLDSPSNFQLFSRSLEDILFQSQNLLARIQNWCIEVLRTWVQRTLENYKVIGRSLTRINEENIPENIEESSQNQDQSSNDLERIINPIPSFLHTPQANSNLELEIAVFKTISLFPKSSEKEKNRYLFLQPKISLKKNYVGLKLDLHKGTDTQPSVLLNYKQFMLGLKNHQKQPYIVLGKNISINNIPVNFQIKGCLPLTLNKKKLLTNFEGNINATQNFKIQKHINSHFLKNFGLEGKSSINLFSFSKSSLKVFSSSKNNTESKSFFNKSSLDKNLKIVKNLKPTLFIPNGVNLNNTEKNEFFEKREFDLDGYPLRRSLNSINLNEPHLSAQSISVNESNWNNFPQHKNSGGSLVVLTTVGLATSLIFIYRLTEKSFFFKPYDEII
jgi:hypothetical protein